MGEIFIDVIIIDKYKGLKNVSPDTNHYFYYRTTLILYTKFFFIFFPIDFQPAQLIFDAPPVLF
jgi:hypothetical protein